MKVNVKQMLTRLAMAESVTLPADTARTLCECLIEAEKALKASDQYWKCMDEFPPEYCIAYADKAIGLNTDALALLHEKIEFGGEE